MRFQSRAKEGHLGIVWEVLASMKITLHHLETLKTHYVDQSVAKTYHYEELDPQDLSLSRNSITSVCCRRPRYGTKLEKGG